MFSSIKNRDDFEKLKEFFSFQIQTKALRLQSNVRKEKFQEDRKKLFEPAIETIKIIDASEDVIKALKITSKENNKALANLNNKLRERMIVRGILASCLLSSLTKITSLKHTGHF